MPFKHNNKTAKINTITLQFNKYCKGLLVKASKQQKSFWGWHSICERLQLPLQDELSWSSVAPHSVNSGPLISRKLLELEIWDFTHTSTLGVGNYCANFSENRFSGGFSPNRSNITPLWLFWLSCPVLFLDPAPRSKTANIKCTKCCYITTCKAHHWVTHIKQKKIISSHHGLRI